jgi:hypothetical protein
LALNERTDRCAAVSEKLLESSATRFGEGRLGTPTRSLVLDKIREWQNRPLDTVYPIVFFDALRVKKPRCAYFV